MMFEGVMISYPEIRKRITPKCLLLQTLLRALTFLCLVFLCLGYGQAQIDNSWNNLRNTEQISFFKIMTFVILIPIFDKYFLEKLIVSE